MTTKYNFTGNVQAGAIGDNSKGILNSNNNPQILNIDDFKHSLDDLIENYRNDNSISSDTLSSIGFLKKHADDVSEPSDAKFYWEKLKNCGGEICQRLKSIVANIGCSAVASWIIEGINSL